MWWFVALLVAAPRPELKLAWDGGYIASNVIDDAWLAPVRRPPPIRDTPRGLEIRQPIRVAELPSELARVIGTEVTLQAPGERCRGKVVGYEAVATDMYAKQLADWDRMIVESHEVLHDEKEPWREAIWSMRRLVAKVDAPCAHRALVAGDDAEALVGSTPNPETAAAIDAVVRAHSWVAMQREAYEQRVPGGPWDVRPEIQVFTDRAGQTRFALMSLGADDWCDVPRSWFALALDERWEVTTFGVGPSPAGVVVTAAGPSLWFAVGEAESLVDFDGEPQLEAGEVPYTTYECGFRGR